LGEWAVSDGALVAGLRARAAFRNVTDDDFGLLAENGRLVLLLDGWNELDGDAQRRLRSELARLRREMPLLRIVISTRREALDVPVAGPTVEIDGLSEDQQLEIARAMRGEEGGRLVDQAWRTPGVRSLVAIPLYLTALLKRAPGAQMPSTKEEVLRFFIEEHERSADRAEALSRTLLGHHTDLLAALAVTGIGAGTAALAEEGARATVSQVETRLQESGQWRQPPEPAIALAALIDHHLLVRAGQDGAVAFQHQQFEEWYGALEVERVMAASADGDAAARRRLRADILNAPAWEESILFACERGSRAGEAQHAAVADAILLALEIDPMLAAEMIYRSTGAVWERVRERAVAFGRNWHQPGRLDRAVRFMITSGRREFGADLWPLISSADTQVALPALRIARRFRPSVLGPDAGARIAALPEEQRAHVLSEIASRSGFDGMELATAVAKADPSPQVRVGVIEALQFRRGERHVAELLTEAPDEVWHLLAAKGYAMEFADPSAAARLRAERDCQIANDPSPTRRLYGLLESDEAAETVGQRIADLIAAPDFPANDRDTGWTVHRAFERFPSSVAAGLLRRVAAGLEIPFRGEEMLAGVDAVDDGPVAAVALDPTANRFVGQTAATVVGPGTVGALIDALADAAVEGRQQAAPEAAAARERYQQLLGRITAARPSSVADAVLARVDTEVPQTIGMLADLLVKQGGFDARVNPLLPEGDLKRALVAALHRWVEVLLASAESTRYQLAEIAQALGRLGAPESLPALLRLLDEDLARRRRAMEEVRAAQARRAVVDMSDARMSYVLQYRFAFIAIGGEAAASMIPYLDDPDFGFEAACILKALWDRRQGEPKEQNLSGGIDFSEVAARRAAKQAGRCVPAAPEAEAIFAVVERLLRGDADVQAQVRATGLASIGLTLPYGDKTVLIERLLGLPLPVRNKQRLLTGLILAGEPVAADIVVEGIRAFLEEAQQKTWMLHQNNRWELDGWLGLLPFTDRPEATVTGVEMVIDADRHPHRMEEAVKSLSVAPGEAAERALGEFARRFPALAGEYEWIKAFTRRRTIAAIGMLLDHLAEPGWQDRRGGTHLWSVARDIAALAADLAGLQEELLRRFGAAMGAARQVIEQALAKLGGPACVMALARDHAAHNQPFNGFLGEAIRETALAREPAAGWAGAFELHPVAVTELRRDLFAMLGGTPAEAAVAGACLTVIDELRDEYGPAGLEPRHPDIKTGRPWPVVT
jgi:hypothetical protein